jgi:hypothetical protein
MGALGVLMFWIYHKKWASFKKTHRKIRGMCGVHVQKEVLGGSKPKLFSHL